MKKYFPFLVSFLFLVSSLGFGQDSLPIRKIDSLLISAKDSLIIMDSTLIGPELSQQLLTPSLEELIKKGRTYSLMAHEIMMELQESMDTTRLAEEIPNMQQTVTAIRERTKNPNTQFNFRYVNALLRILKATEENNQELDVLVQKRLDRLNDLDSLLKTVKNDQFFKYKIRDTLLLPMYSDEIFHLKENLHILDSTIYKQELQAARYQSQLSNITTGIRELRRYVDINKSQLEKNLFKKEINFIWESYSIPSPKSIFQITIESIKLNYLFLVRQLKTDLFITYLALIILIGGFLLVYRTLKSIRSDKEFGSIILSRIKYLDKRPFASVMVALLPLVFYMFDTGSIALLTFFMYLLVFFSSFLIYNAFPIRVFIKWMILVVIFIFFTISNLYWEIAYQERMYFQIGNILTLIILSQIPKKFTSDDPSEVTFLKRLRILTMILLTAGILSNILGRYSLAKILSISGLVSFVYAVTLYFFIKVIMEIIYVIVENKKEVDSFTSYIDFKGIQERIRGVFLFLAFLFWTVILLHNLSLSEYVYTGLEEFLSKERTLGAASFTFSSILLFASLVFVSYMLANNIAYFASIKDQKNSNDRTKKLGSSVLLIRLAILTIGFFIAATAAQIPLDKITIVLGALSVGIGFGLQTIINNLVSGVILAFERPIQIGDDIEVGNMSGQVKEVGIRASKILSYDGAEVVIPNGDLLSQSLINWTLSDKRRRIELNIGVAYDSDMKLVRQILEKALDRDRILKVPPPRILMQKFNDSSVDFRLLFWIESMDIFLEMRNEVMTAIFDAFQENGIEIPFPKRDLYIKSLPEEMQKTTENKKSPEN